MSHCIFRTFWNIKKLAAMHRSVRILSGKYLEVFPIIALHKSFIFHYWIRSSSSSNTLTVNIDIHINRNSFINLSPIKKWYRAELWTCSILKLKTFTWSKLFFPHKPRIVQLTCILITSSWKKQFICLWWGGGVVPRLVFWNVIISILPRKNWRAVTASSDVT